MDPTILIPIIISLGAFALVFGLRYLSNKERMGMIEKGLTPEAPQKRPSRPLQSLKWGLIISGVGFGLLLSFIFTNYFISITRDDAAAIYFGLIAMFGGLGLVISYTFEKRYEEKDQQHR